MILISYLGYYRYVRAGVYAKHVKLIQIGSPKVALRGVFVIIEGTRKAYDPEFWH